MLKEENSRRSFFKKAAAAAGVVAAACVTRNLITEPTDSIAREGADYANQDGAQEKIMSQKQFVLMTDDEKKQMLDEILNNYRKELA